MIGLSVATTGLAPLAYGLGIAAPLDRLIDRHGAAVAARVALTGLTLVYLCLAAVSGSVLGVIALCTVWGLMNHPGLNLLVGRLAALDPTQRGAVMGLYSAVTYLAVFAGAVLYRPVFDRLGFAACDLLSAVCVVLTTGSIIEHRSAEHRPAHRRPG